MQSLIDGDVDWLRSSKTAPSPPTANFSSNAR